MTTDKRCTQPDCDAKLLARGRCRKHYMQWHRSHQNEIAGPGDDPRMGFCKRLSELLSEAPDDLMTATEKEVIVGFAMTAAMAARGIVPLTPEMRAAVLHKAVDRITAEAAQ